MTAKRRIIFLDVDGVLNSFRSAEAFGGTLHRWDPVAIGLIARLAETAGAEVVVSSTWREMEPFPEAFRHMLSRSAGEGMARRIPIVDRTPVLDVFHRGREIDAWLREHGAELGAYVIIDDDERMLPYQRPHLVLTDPLVGFGIQDFQRALDILNGAPAESAGSQP